MKQYWVYILHCSDGSFYTGSTSNLEQRLAQHQAGTFPGYTKSRLPIKCVFSQEFEDVNNAIIAERKVKKWSRSKKEALINGNYKALHRLSNCQNETHYKNKQ